MKSGVISIRRRCCTQHLAGRDAAGRAPESAFVSLSLLVMREILVINHMSAIASVGCVAEPAGTRLKVADSWALRATRRRRGLSLDAVVLLLG